MLDAQSKAEKDIADKAAAEKILADVAAKNAAAAATPTPPVAAAVPPPPNAPAGANGVANSDCQGCVALPRASHLPAVHCRCV